jgi:hypothetical protein
MGYMGGDDKPEHMGGRDTELLNLELLARQAWCILQQHITLSAHMIKAIYYPSNDLFERRIGISPFTNMVSFV